MNMTRYSQKKRSLHHDGSLGLIWKNSIRMVASLELGKRSKSESPRLVRNPISILKGVCLLLIRFGLKMKRKGARSYNASLWGPTRTRSVS